MRSPSCHAARARLQTRGWGRSRVGADAAPAFAAPTQMRRPLGLGAGGPQGSRLRRGEAERSLVGGAQHLGDQPAWGRGLCVPVRARACVHACMRVWVHARVCVCGEGGDLGFAVSRGEPVRSRATVGWVGGHHAPTPAHTPPSSPFPSTMGSVGTWAHPAMPFPQARAETRR